MISKKLHNTPLKIVGFLALLAMLATFAVANAVAKDSSAAPVLTFDVSEHRAKPDISAIPRIRFLTTLDFPPFNFMDQQGRLSGFNVDLAREICAELEVTAKCQVQALPFNELESALESRAGDAVIAGVAVTPALRKRFDFTQAYLQMPARFLASKGTGKGDPSLATLSRLKIGVIKDTAHEAMLRAFFPGINPVQFDSRDMMLNALKSGEVAAVFSDGMQLAFWQATKDAGDCCQFWGGPYYSQDFLGEGMTIMTRQSEPLAAAFDHALLNLAKDGKLNDLFVKYFPAGLY